MDTFNIPNHFSGYTKTIAMGWCKYACYESMKTQVQILAPLSKLEGGLMYPGNPSAVWDAHRRIAGAH